MGWTHRNRRVCPVWRFERIPLDTMNNVDREAVLFLNS